MLFEFAQIIGVHRFVNIGTGGVTGDRLVVPETADIEPKIGKGVLFQNRAEFAVKLGKIQGTRRLRPVRLPRSAIVSERRRKIGTDSMVGKGTEIFIQNDPFFLIRRAAMIAKNRIER